MSGPKKELQPNLWEHSVDWSAVADRIETIVHCLTNRKVAKNVTIDYRVAARAVEYCRRRANNHHYTEVEMEIREDEMMDFVLAHGQSLDWVMIGDPVDMIATLATGTSSRKRPHFRTV